MEPISLAPPGYNPGPKVLGDSPAMPLGKTYQIARGLIRDGGAFPQGFSNDAVTLSPEAQAAADVLEPTS